MNEPDRSDRDDEVPPLHPLEIPLVWFGIQFAELAIVGPLLWAFLRGDRSKVVVTAITVVVLTGLVALNYAIRRRFIPH